LCAADLAFNFLCFGNNCVSGFCPYNAIYAVPGWAGCAKGISPQKQNALLLNRIAIWVSQNITLFLEFWNGCRLYLRNAIFDSLKFGRTIARIGFRRRSSRQCANGGKVCCASALAYASPANGAFRCESIGGAASARRVHALNFANIGQALLDALLTCRGHDIAKFAVDALLVDRRLGNRMCHLARQRLGRTDRVQDNIKYPINEPCDLAFTKDGGGFTCGG